jgi:hypothetical protein
MQEQENQEPDEEELAWQKIDELRKKKVKLTWEILDEIFEFPPETKVWNRAIYKNPNKLVEVVSEGSFGRTIWENGFDDSDAKSTNKRVQRKGALVLPVWEMLLAAADAGYNIIPTHAWPIYQSFDDFVQNDFFRD